MSRVVHQLMSVRSLDDCLACAGDGDLVLLVDAGVGLLVDGSLLENLLVRFEVKASAVDTRCRGLLGQAEAAGVDLLSDAGWVRAALDARHVLSWP